MEQLHDELLKVLAGKIKDRYGDLDDNRGCYCNKTWLSVAEIMSLIYQTDEEYC